MVNFHFPKIQDGGSQPFYPDDCTNYYKLQTAKVDR